MILSSNYGIPSVGPVVEGCFTVLRELLGLVEAENGHVYLLFYDDSVRSFCSCHRLSAVGLRLEQDTADHLSAHKRDASSSRADACSSRGSHLIEGRV